jgi:hypothetical protein
MAGCRNKVSLNLLASNSTIKMIQEVLAAGVNVTEVRSSCMQACCNSPAGMLSHAAP